MSSTKEIKVRETVTKKLCKKETLFEESCKLDRLKATEQTNGLVSLADQNILNPVSVNESSQTKLKFTKIYPPTSLNINFLTLENPLKVTDSFNSPVVENQSLNLFNEKMGISRYKQQSGLFLSTDKKLRKNKNGNSAESDDPILKRNNKEQNINATTNYSQSALMANKFISNNFNEKPPLPKRNFDRKICIKNFSEKPNIFEHCCDTAYDFDCKNKDEFNMAKLEKLLLMRGNIKYADDNEDRKCDESIPELPKKLIANIRRNENFVIEQDHPQKNCNVNVVNKSAIFKNVTLENNSNCFYGKSTLSSDYCSEDTYDYDDYVFGRE
ncbi:hypothetical protein HELRODRAFT_184505 [Helobdella robusta]|uniref:Uncharacterized protein n=1 Tax=Helobdella robusta TaxID=6412 RepID=T1FLC5_HELRO|nr:hypothetical protein HELRODRAFT_184505 [Helobdella robusta]ESN93274.1 hypothetical protein HELRODRAFT_184505 [Helobdella robusta]